MSQNDRDYEEKRDFIRMRVNAKIKLIKEGEEIEAVCLDISGSGLQVQGPQSFRVGETLNVQIVSEHKELPGLRAATLVVWVNPDQKTLGLKIQKVL